MRCQAGTKRSKFGKCRMPSDFTRHLMANARYWPSLFWCRVRILDHMFCTIGNGHEWEDGGFGRLAPKRVAEARFAMQNEAKKRQHVSTAEFLARTFPDDSDMCRVRFTPTRVRTDAQVQRVLRDRRLPYKGEELAERLEDGGTLFYPLSENYSRCFTVPDDVRPDWLAGVRECLGMVVKWDVPAQVALANKALAQLEARFGPPSKNYKRRMPPPQPVAPPVAEVGRTVRVDLDGECSWGEHRPDLGPNVYRSLNQTLSNVKLKLPDEHPDILNGKAKNGRKANMCWGHLFVGTERKEGRVKPLHIIGIDLTPVPPKEVAA